MNTTEKNILITEFMGSKVTIDTYFINGMYMTITETDLKFHSDWNWLMEVVEKCLEKHNSLVDGRDTIETPYNQIAEALNSISKEEVFEACVEFIQWFNENKK